MEGFALTAKLLWVALLLWALSGRSIEGTSKALVSLNPPWNRIFRNENVTLHCNGSSTAHSSQTEWFYNGSSMSVQTPSFSINFATINNSGEYSCKTSTSSLSDPMYLEVHSDWLLLQASPVIMEEGDSLRLRCHGWKNRTVYKVTYYHNNNSLKYWYENFDYHISHATRKHKGLYHCTGILWRKHYTSKSLHIRFKVKKGAISKMQFLIPLMMGILFVVDTALLVLTQKQLNILIEKERILASKCPPKADAKAESKAKSDDEAKLDPEPQPELEPEPEHEFEPPPDPEAITH